jgi:2-succinyl-5-enolpyruvyl-6-hydroxy-3-cyclohexene-1-carboxylate synthase
MKHMRDRTYTTEEVVQLGREIYEREIRVQVEASHDGEFVVVDVTTGAWEVDEDDVAASERVLAKNSDAVLYFARVGRRAAYRLGHRLDVR